MKENNAPQWVRTLDGTMEAPRTVEDVFDNFNARRSGLIKALTGGARIHRPFFFFCPLGFFFCSSRFFC